MWPLTQVHRANIPPELRAEFETYGEAVVAQMLGTLLPLTSTTLGLPNWAVVPEERQAGLAWLREKHDEETRRHNVTMAMELAILLLVGVEAASTLHTWARDISKWLGF